MDSVDPTRRRMAKSKHGLWPSTPPLSTFSPLSTGLFPSKRLPVGGDPAPPKAARRAAEHHRSHGELRALPHLHVDVDAPWPCTMPADTMASPPGPCSRHLPSNAMDVSQIASFRASTWLAPTPFLSPLALTTLPPVAPPQCPPMACPSSTLHPAHGAPLRGYKSPQPPPLLTTPAPRLSCTI